MNTGTEEAAAAAPRPRALIFVFDYPRSVRPRSGIARFQGSVEAAGYDVVGTVVIRAARPPRNAPPSAPAEQSRAEAIAATLAESEVFASAGGRLAEDHLLVWLRARVEELAAIVIGVNEESMASPFPQELIELWQALGLEVRFSDGGTLARSQLELWRRGERVSDLIQAAADEMAAADEGPATVFGSAPAEAEWGDDSVLYESHARAKPRPRGEQNRPWIHAGDVIGSAYRHSREDAKTLSAPSQASYPASATPPSQPDLPVGSREEPLPHDGLYIRRNNAYSVKSSPRITDLIEQGVLVDQTQISFDDFLAANDDRVPSPPPGQAIAVSHGFVPAPDGFKSHDQTTHLLEIAIKAAAPPQQEAETRSALPVNFVFVIDTSYSMHGQKLDQVKTAIRELYGRLRDNDVLGLVTFDTEVRTLLRATRKAEISVARIQQLVGGLSASGGTDINLGIRFGIDEIRRHSENGQHLNCVYVFSDGDPTSGERSWINIRADIASRIRGDVTISCFGFGSDARMRELDALAGLSGGHSRFVTHSDDLRLDLEEDLSRRDHLAAVNVQLKIEIPAALTIWHLYGHDLITDPALRAAVRAEAQATGNRAERDYGVAPAPDLIADEDGIRVFTPDLAFGETYWMVFELQAATDAEPADAGSATVQFLDTVTRENQRVELQLGAPGTIDEDAVLAHAVGLRTSEVTFYAIDDLYQNDLDTATARLNGHIQTLAVTCAKRVNVQFQNDQITIRKLISLAQNLGQTVSWSDGVPAPGAPAPGATIFAMNAFGQVRGGHMMMRQIGIR